MPHHEENMVETMTDRIKISFALSDAKLNFRLLFEIESQWPHGLLSKRLSKNDNQTFSINQYSDFVIFITTDGDSTS